MIYYINILLTDKERQRLTQLRKVNQGLWCLPAGSIYSDSLTPYKLSTLHTHTYTHNFCLISPQ